MNDAPVEYRVSLADRRRHLFRVEARLPLARGDAARPVESLAPGGELELRFPVWTPGSYLVREYQRHAQDLAVTDEEGRPLATRKTAKETWRVTVSGARFVVARYAVYAHELTVRTAHLDDTHAFWNGACLFLYVDGLRERACEVTIDDVPAGWVVSTGLEFAVGPHEPHRFRAEDFDWLVDCPVEVGTQDRLEWKLDGVSHELAIWGRTDETQRERLLADVRRICESQARLLGDDRLPYPHYTFLVHLAPSAHGGLEHRTSSTILGSPHAFLKDARYQDLLELVSHEFFHLWNGKRIYPEALAPTRGGIDYQRECHTRSLWVVEGWTSYYDRLTLRRAELLTAERYLEKLADELGKLAAIPGRRHQSVEQSSFDAWIKLYRPDENSRNTTVSYYLKGSIVALLLDLEIRRRSSGQRSLDDALRLLWREHGQTGRGYADDAVQPLVERAAGVSLEDFFARAVRSTEELDVDGPLASVGLRVRPKHGDGDDDREHAWLGANLAQEGTRLKVVDTLEGGPAQAAGLSAGDEIVALEGWRVDDEKLKEQVAARRPGDVVRLAVFRRDELRELPLPLGARPVDKLEIVPLESPTDAQQRAYESWLGAPFPSTK